MYSLTKVISFKKFDAWLSQFHRGPNTEVVLRFHVACSAALRRHHFTPSTGSLSESQLPAGGSATAARDRVAGIECDGKRPVPNSRIICAQSFGRSVWIECMDH